MSTKRKLEDYGNMLYNWKDIEKVSDRVIEEVHYLTHSSVVKEGSTMSSRLLTNQTAL